MTARSGLLLGLLVWLASGQALAEDRPSLREFARALGKTVWEGVGETVVARTVQTLEKLHPASLARHGRAPGLALEEGWQEAPLDRPLVIAVHGFYSNRDRAGSLLKAPIEAGFPVGWFEYASDRPIEESARLLSESLRAVAAQQPQREVVLVTHSMGGIVSRTVIEDPELDPGNVRRLIMIAPPNHGTALASLPREARLQADWEEPEGEAATRWGEAAVLAALGPAAEQLRLGSDFLNELNSRPRNPRVTYTIILGTKAPLPAVAAKAAQAAAEETDHRWRWSRWVGVRIKQRLADLPEVQRGAGDGVVSVESGRLEGVDDVVLLPFHHIEPLWDEDEPAVQQLSCEVLHRLR